MPSVLSELSKTHDDEPKIEAATAAQCVLFCVSSHIKIYFFKKLHRVINQWFCATKLTHSNGSENHAFQILRFENQK